MAAMTPVPLFQTFDALRLVLRLEGLNEGSGAMAVLHSAIKDARTEFWRRLGAQRVTELTLLPDSEMPATDEEYLRSLSRVTEEKLVRGKLLEILTAKFREGASDLEDWNDTAAFRSMSSFQRDQDLKRIRKDVDDAFDLLALDESPGDEATVSAIDVAPPAGPHYLGQGVFR